jgi:hypothetical protein
MSGNNNYAFLTRWRVEGTIEEVSDILGDAEDLVRWWPSVYLEVHKDADGVVHLYTRGWLPYTLRWQFRVTEDHYPRGFSLEAWGDFVGHGAWTLKQDGAFADVIYEWRIRADKPLLRSFSFIFKPLFSANHRWAMARGEESLKRELLRRRGQVAAGKFTRT